MISRSLVDELEVGEGRARHCLEEVNGSFLSTSSITTTTSAGGTVSSKDDQSQRLHIRDLHTFQTLISIHLCSMAFS